MIEILGWFVFLIGFLLFPLAILLPILIAVNVKGLRTNLFSKCSRIPGFRSGTTWKSALGTFFYISLVALILTIGGALMIGPVEDNLEVSDTTISENRIIVGDSIEVAGTAENTGNETETFTVELTADGSVLETEEVSLEPNETKRVDFRTSIDDTGEYTIEMHETVVGSVVVQDSIVIEETRMNDEVVALGDSVNVFGTVANIGNSSDIATVELLVDGEIVDTKEMELDSGGEQEVEFSQKFDEEGDYEIRINDVSVGTISARETDCEEVVSLGGYTRDSERFEVEEGQYIVITVENNAGFRTRGVLNYGNEIPFGESVQGAGNEESWRVFDSGHPDEIIEERTGGWVVRYEPADPEPSTSGSVTVNICTPPEEQG